MAVVSFPRWVRFSIIEIFTLLSISLWDDKLSSVTNKPMCFVAIGFACIVGLITFMFVHWLYGHNTQTNMRLVVVRASNIRSKFSRGRAFECI